MMRCLRPWRSARSAVMRAGEGPSAKSPRCQTSSSGPTVAFQRSMRAASWAGIEGNGRRSMRSTRESPKWVSLVKNVVMRRFSQAHGDPNPRPLPFLDLVDLLLQEVVERGPKHRNGRELSDLVPGRSDRGAQNIGGEQEFEPERQPTSEAEPDLLLVIIGVTR